MSSVVALLIVATLIGCEYDKSLVPIECIEPAIFREGDFIISASSAVEDIAALAPAGNNCFSITGDLIIAETDLSNLEPLGNLSSIGGDLRIRFNGALTGLSNSLCN